MKHIILPRYPLGNPRHKYRQKQFTLSAFCVVCNDMRKAIQKCFESGFNLIELSGAATHEQSEEAVTLCEEIDIDLVFQDFSVFGGFQKKHIERKVTKEAVRSLTSRLNSYKHVIGYYIWDEPHLDDQIAEARNQTDIFLDFVPNSLAISVAIPSYNSLYTWENGEFEGYLKRYTETIDPPILSLDYYPIGLSSYTDEKELDDSLFWCDLALLRKLSIKHSIPMWFYYQGINLYNYHRFTFPMVRMMMYAAAMYGAKGLQEFTAVHAIFTEDGNKGMFFEEQKQIHKEFTALGNTLMALKSLHVFHSFDLLSASKAFEPYRENPSNSYFISSINSKRTSVGEFSDDYRNVYFLILNREYDSSVELDISLKGQFRIFEISKENGEQILLNQATDKIKLQFEAGDGRLFRLQDAGTDAFTIHYQLSANQHTHF